MEASKFIWAYKSLKNNWQEDLSVTLCICTANTRHRLDAEVNHNSLSTNAESPKGFKCTSTFWSCNLMHIKVLLYVLARRIPTWQGTKQTHCVWVSEWAPSQPWLHPWANPPSLTESCLELEAFPLKERVKFPFPSHRSCDRHKCFGGLVSDSHLEQLGSAWVGFTANVLQVKQAPVQPLPARGYRLPRAFCCGQADGKRRKTKHVPATHPGEEQLQQNCQVLFFLSQSLHSDVVVVSPLGRAHLPQYHLNVQPGTGGNSSSNG